METGIELIAADRERQIAAEGWSAAHDDEHKACEISRAGCCYAAIASLQVVFGGDLTGSTPDGWPLDPEWWKPSGSPLRNLVKAGALITAEIDRLQRA